MTKKLVWKHCRANKETGREIFCPKCDEINIVYHFSWSSLKCWSCRTFVDKYEWWTKNNQTKKKCNGWSNRETWLTYVWFGDFFGVGKNWNWDKTEIKEFVEIEVFGEDGCRLIEQDVHGFVTDLIDLSAINYSELAKHFNGVE